MLSSPVRKQRGFMGAGFLSRSHGGVGDSAESSSLPTPLREHLSSSPESVCVPVPLVDQLALGDNFSWVGT